MKSSGCKTRPAKASEQAGSECCHSPGDWWVRSVHSKETGREDSAAKSFLRPDADVFSLAEGNIWRRPLGRGRAGIGGVPSPGHVPKRLAGNSRELPISSPPSEAHLWNRGGRYVHPRVDRRGHGRRVE